MSETKRTEREDETRQKTVRPSDAWIPPSKLPSPREEPGFVFRWVRTATHGQADNTNVSMQMRSGWVPVKAEDYKYLLLTSDVGSQFKGNIEVGGLLLCKAPRELMEQRDEYFRKAAHAQMDTVDNSFMKQNDSRMPLLQPDRKTRTTFGSREPCCYGVASNY